MKRLNKAALALTAVCVLSSGVAQAALFDRGGGLIYDNVLKITWLSDANYAKTNNYDSDGLMNWTAAKAWAAGLSYGGYHDWRLPTALSQDGSGPCGGYNCYSSEMGHLFYIDGGLSQNQSITTSATLTNYFTNMQSNVYWSGTAYVYFPTEVAWLFGTSGGTQSTDFQSKEFHAWAVRPGDVAAVPEPEAYALLIAGLGLLGMVAKRRRRLYGAS